MTVLQSDARISNLALAERVALSPSACLTRVHRLLAAGVFSAFRAHLVMDQVRPEAVVILAEITLRQHHPAAFEQFETLLGRLPQVVEAAQVSGAFDYLLKVVVPNLAVWRTLAARLQSERQAVIKVTTHIVLKEAKAFSGVPLD